MNELQEWAKRNNISIQAMVELSRLFEPRFQAIPGGSEAFTQAALRVAAPQVGGALWRNNNGAYLDETGRMVRYGVGNDSKKLNEVWKSSDLIGITPMGGYGVFTAVEVKAPGWRGPSNAREQAQFNYLTTVESLGGIGMFATSVDDYLGRVRK